MAPAFGRFAGLISTLTILGALPLKADVVSQAPPSAVLGVIVNFNLPLPALPIRRFCGVTVLALCGMVKLICPGRLLKNAPEPTTLSVMGTATEVDGFVSS